MIQGVYGVDYSGDPIPRGFFHHFPYETGSFNLPSAPYVLFVRFCFVEFSSTSLLETSKRCLMIKTNRTKNILFEKNWNFSTKLRLALCFFGRSYYLFIEGGWGVYGRRQAGDSVVKWGNATPKRWRLVFGAMINQDKWEWRSRSILSRFFYWNWFLCFCFTWRVHRQNKTIAPTQSPKLENRFLFGAKGLLSRCYVMATSKKSNR